MTIIRPPRLKKGDLIGIITPASPTADPARIDRGVRYLESLGYRTLVGPNVGRVHGYLAGTDEERAADLNAMFSNKHVRGIICVRGGYGTPRILSLLDYRTIRRNPKILAGYSDITALQCALWKKCGLVTFHGPMAGVEMAGEFDPFSEEMFWHMLTSTRRMKPIVFESDAVQFNPAKVTGRLVGGNLALLVSLVGTRYAPSFKNAILFLEEIGEEPYRVDRMLVHLKHASVFSTVRGALLGQFTDCVPADPSKPSLSTSQVIAEMMTSCRLPALGNLPFGHVPRKLTLPLGIEAEIKVRKRTLRFREAAVV